MIDCNLCDIPVIILLIDLLIFSKRFLLIRLLPYWKLKIKKVKL